MPVRIYAHRGASAEYPENTMEAFRRAIDCGVDALEMDIHATSDGVLVVHHCGVARAISDVTFAELRGWNAGAGFVAADGSRPFARNPLAIPRFEDVVAEFAGVPLNVDLKHDSAERTIELLRRTRAEARVCLASFEARTIRRVRALGYTGPTALAQAEVITALLVPPVLQRGPLRVRATRAQLPTSLGRGFVVARMRKLGLAVDYWTVDDVAEARRLVALGADGIMTNDPARIVPALRQ
jgi:glycerophosphoryl diester phosphodiesterase